MKIKLCLLAFGLISGNTIWAQDNKPVCLDYPVYKAAERAGDLLRPYRDDPCGNTQWRMQAIEVFGDRAPRDPGSVSLLTEDEIKRLAADHPAEGLNQLPGINIHMNSGQEHLIAIRSPVLTGGAGQGSFLIMENGIPTRSPAFGNVNLLLEPHHETAEALEVVRGPGSAKYGSNAVHGLINVILADPAGTPSAELRAAYGSLGRYKADLIFDQGYLGRASVSLHKDTGWRDHTGLFQLKSSGVIETVLSGWDLTAWGSVSHLEQETADFLQGDEAYKDRTLSRSNDDPLAYRDAWSARGAVRFERQLGAGSLQITPFARIQQMDFRQHFLPYKGFEKNGHTAFGGQFVYGLSKDTDLFWRLGSDMDLARGYLRETQPDPFGFFPGDSRFPVGLHYDYTVDTAALALWGDLDWQATPALRFLFGVRGETHEYDYQTDAPVGLNGRFRVPSDRKDSFSFVTPKLGLVFDLNSQISAYANYARGSRAPQASDLYRLQSLQGVAEADVEILDSLELGLRGYALQGDLVYDLAAYHMEKQNFFFRDANGLNVSDGATRHQGVEIQLDWQLLDHFSLAGQLSWSDQTYIFDRVVGNGSELIVSGNRIDTAPEWLADLSAIWTPFKGLDIQLSAEYVGEYFTNPANTETYEGHIVLHLTSSWQASDRLEFYARVRNLSDTAYADRADFAFGNARYFPGEPVNLTLGLRKRF